MKVTRYLLPLMAIFLIICGTAYSVECCGGRCDRGDVSTYDSFLSDRDFDALYNYINTKRTMNLNEKGCNLTISGDVRVDWRNIYEKKCGKRQRGGDAVLEDPSSGVNNAQAVENGVNSTNPLLPGHHHDCIGGTPISNNDFDIEFNLRFDYVCDRAWAVAHLWYDNTAGVWNNGKSCEQDPEGAHGSGHCCDVCLKKAYMGYNVCCECGSRFDVELGRRNLYDVFDSEVQFLSRFDGVLLRFSSCWDCLGEWYVNLGGFVVDERVNHFAWVMETGFLNICDTGFDFKYSFIDWVKNGSNVCGIHDPLGYRYRNSQFTLYYHFCPELICQPAYLFGAVIINHAAPKTSLTWGDKDNIAWYAGFQIGEVIEEGDWAFQIQYQYVAPQAVMDQDVSGIGRGNTNNDSPTESRRGNGNYKGWRFEGIYALTDNLSFDTKFEFSTQLKDDVGGNHSYSNFKLEAIYAF